MTTLFPDSDSLRHILDQASEDQRRAFFASGWWHSIDLGGGHITPGVHKIDELRDNYNRFDLPEDLSGKRVLDIGCWDGFYSFEAERHGAEVVAIDCWRPENFFKAHEVLRSHVTFKEMSVYELKRQQFGTFDIVLFLGVLYHLRHPLLALERICELTHGVAVIESHVIDNIRDTSDPVMEFYEIDELGGQYDNWWGPNTTCLTAMLRAAGFVRTEVLRREPARSTIKAHRCWENKAREAHPSLLIRDITNAVTNDHVFPQRGRFAFLSLWVEGLPERIKSENLHVEVGRFGARPYSIEPSLDGADNVPRTQVNIEVPPGLDAGPTKVRISYEDRVSSIKEIGLVEGGEW